MNAVQHLQLYFGELHDAELASICRRGDSSVNLAFTKRDRQYDLVVEGVNDPVIVASGMVFPLIVSTLVLFDISKLTGSDIPLIHDASGVLFWNHLKSVSQLPTWMLVTIANYGDDFAVLGMGNPVFSFTESKMRRPT